MGAAYKIGTEYYDILNSDVNGTILISCSTGTFIKPTFLGGVDVGSLQLETHTDLPKDFKITIFVIHLSGFF